MKKPPELRFAADDMPSLQLLILNAIQHAGVLALTLVFPLAVGRAANLDAEELVAFISLTLIGMAVGNALVGLGRWPGNSGYLVPLAPATVYATPVLMAVEKGGMSLLAGMTVIAGGFALLLAVILPRLRAFFTTEIAGLVILIVGLGVSLFGLGEITRAVGADGGNVVIGLAALATMVAIMVWGSGHLASCATLIAVGGSTLLHVAMQGGVALPASAPLASPKLFVFGGFAFDPSLMLPFAVTILAVMLLAVGNVTNAQKINDAEWIRPDMRSIRGGGLSVGIGIIACGLLHGCPVATNSSCVGLSRATGVASRRLAFAIAGCLLLFAFSPRLLALLATIPDVVIGVTWLMLGAYIIMSGMEIITSRLLDARRSLIVGLSLPIGFSAHFHPELYAKVPAFLTPITGDMLTLGATSAVLLNALFRLGVRRKVRLDLAGEAAIADRVHDTMRLQGAKWAARADVIDRASFALTQLLEALGEHGRIERDLVVEAAFDEFSLVVTVSYAGSKALFPEEQPPPDAILDDDGVERLAGYLVRRAADRLKLGGNGARQQVTLIFDH